MTNKILFKPLIISLAGIFIFSGILVIQKLTVVITSVYQDCRYPTPFAVCNISSIKTNESCRDYDYLNNKPIYLITNISCPKDLSVGGWNNETHIFIIDNKYLEHECCHHNINSNCFYNNLELNLSAVIGLFFEELRCSYI